MNVMETDEKFVNSHFVPRNPDAHKGSFGRAVIIGGSLNYVGAPQLAAESTGEVLKAFNDGHDGEIIDVSYSAEKLSLNGRASMLSGCGLSTLAVPDFLFSALYPVVKFSSLYKLSSDGEKIIYREKEIDALISIASSFAVGMGMGEGESDKIIGRILDVGTQNFVVDADALIKTVDFDFKGRAVLTPHAGEAARLIGKSVDFVKYNSQNICLEYAKAHNCVVLLKGAVSYISDGKVLYKNATGNVKLAKGGSGDVLSGVIAGLLAWGNSPVDAAAVGAYLCGRCAELSPVNDYSHLPSDTISQLPLLLSSLILK